MPTPPEQQTTTGTTEAHRMQCMEVWGSNSAVDSGVIMAGLDAWVYSRPWHDDTFGGDVHYVSSCATGRITRLLLADVSGHGETVAETAITLRRIMRRYVNHIEQRQFVRMMNRAVTRMEGPRFATSVVASYFAPRSQLIVSNAGHPPPLLHRTRTGQWSYITQAANEQSEPAALTNMPLGVVRETDYDELRLHLEIGDIVLFYSDALIEAHDADGQLLGLDGLLEETQKLDVSSPDTLVQQLRQHIADLYPNNLDGDDLTVLMFRPNGVGGGSTFFTRARAGLRIAGRAIARLLGRREPVPWPELSIEAMLGTPVARFVNRVFRRDNDQTF